MRHRPLLVWAGAFAVGIGLGAMGWLTPVGALGLAVVGLGLLAVGRVSALFLAGLLGLGVCAGALRLAAFEQVPASDVSHFADRPAPVTLIGTVISDPEARRGGRITFFLRAEQLETGRQARPVTGDVSVTLGRNAAAGASVDYGDQLALEGTLETPPGATNPGAFSWRDYLARRAIYCEHARQTTRRDREAGREPAEPVCPSGLDRAPPRFDGHSCLAAARAGGGAGRHLDRASDGTAAGLDG